MFKKKIKELNKEEMTLFSQPFLNSSITSADNIGALRVLTNSEEFGDKVKKVSCSSGAALLSGNSAPTIMRGMVVYRYDNKDATKGTPINVDLYELDDWTLYKIQGYFEQHHLSSIPKKKAVGEKNENL